MAKEKTVSAGTFVQELFHVGLYKRSQGRVTRQVTAAALGLGFALAAWRLQVMLSLRYPALEYIVPGIVLLVGLWASYRIVNIPRFADFLIAVEAEMNKVSWPSKPELIRSAVVVICVILILAAVLFGFDLVWQAFFQWIGVRR